MKRKEDEQVSDQAEIPSSTPEKGSSVESLLLSDTNDPFLPYEILLSWLDKEGLKLQ